MNWYTTFLKPLLFQLSPETAHEWTLKSLQLLSQWEGIHRCSPRSYPTLEKTLCGIRFPHPIGLAAGMDKNAVALLAWEALGFGFIEVGTITAQPQPGNPRPRLFRYPQQQAVINRMGFNNEGADRIAQRLAHFQSCGHWPKIPVGINIGKSKITPLNEAPQDYLYSFKKLFPFGDYFVVNVSSPNTPGLRELQSQESLIAILNTLRQFDSKKPIFVKLAPDLTPSAQEALFSLLEQSMISGLILTNTTLDHSAIALNQDQAGGLSGAPLKLRARELLAAFVQARKAQTSPTSLQSRSQVPRPLPIIASGGIIDAQEAMLRLQSGADLIQLYTGLIYQGPQLIHQILGLLESARSLPASH